MNKFSYFQAWAPVIETPHEGAMITESMYEALVNGKFNKVPLLSGINSEEELSHIASECTDIFKTNLNIR